MLAIISDYFSIKVQIINYIDALLKLKESKVKLENSWLRFIK